VFSSSWVDEGVMPHARDPIELSDGELVERVLGGDTEVYAELVRRHQAPLYRHALGMLGSPDAAADLTQECFIRAYSRLPSCNDPGRFGAWSFRILRNGCLDYLKDRRQETIPIEDEGLLGIADADPQLEVERSEIRDAVQRALAMLPEAQREAFLLKHVEELSYEEMTALIGVSESALKMRVKRAREALQVLLTARHGEEM
jgi:RNA polymerase sigma-70 factor, ECF subfamily